MKMIFKDQVDLIAEVLIADHVKRTDVYKLIEEAIGRVHERLSEEYKNYDPDWNLRCIEVLVEADKIYFPKKEVKNESTTDNK